MYGSTTETSLLDRLHDPRDQTAWRRFDLLYGEVIVRHARRLGLDWADAEEIRQIVAVSLLGAMRTFRLQHERGRFRSYLGRVVGNAVLRYRCKSSRRLEILAPDLTDIAASSLPATDEVWEQEWRDHHLRRALATVRSTYDPRSMKIFERLLNGQSTQEVAQATESSIANV